GHHPAEGGVLLLAGDHRAQRLGAAVGMAAHHGGGGFVTAGLDPQHRQGATVRPRCRGRSGRILGRDLHRGGPSRSTPREASVGPRPPVRIGTRKSLLARTQAGMMQRAIARALGAPESAADEVAPLVFITTTGDQVQDRRLLEIGGKALFTKEIEQALLEGRIDVAIHSMKDVPAVQPEGLVIAAVPPREDPRDAFVSRRFASLDALPQGARLGTASLRRQAQALAARPDLAIEMLRGNVDSRLRRLDAG